MSENEEFEIDTKSAPSLSLSRKACGYFKRYDVGFTAL
jgi:membrane protease subunit (stomatin/prohibitin family)